MEHFKNLSEEGKVFMSLIEQLEADLSELKNRATSGLEKTFNKKTGDIILILKQLEADVDEVRSTADARSKKILEEQSERFMLLIKSLEAETEELKSMAASKTLMEKTFKEYRSLTNQNLSDLSKYLKGLITSQIEHSHERYYAVPETKDEQLCLITQIQSPTSLVVKLDSAVTPADGQSLSIDILVSGISMLTSPIVIDDSLEANVLKDFKLPNRKLLEGETLELELTHNSGTLNTLSGIWVALKYKTILSLAS